MSENETVAPTELLPCPFCGGRDTLWVDDGLCEDGNWVVWCEGGCKSGGAFKPTAEEAKAAWNTRSSVSAQSVEAALAELGEMFPGQSVSIKRQEFYGTGMFHSSRPPFSVSIHVGDIGFSDEENVESAMQSVRQFKEQQ